MGHMVQQSYSPEYNISGYKPSSFNTAAAALSLAVIGMGGWAVSKGMDRSDVAVSAAAHPPSPVIPLTSVVTEQKALELYGKLADNKNIPFEHRSGCFERAEKMRRLLAKDGLQVIKVWAFEQPGAPLKFQEPLTDDYPVTWAYHVAIALRVTGANGQKKIMVMDPKLFDGPVVVSEWANKMGTDANKIYYTNPDAPPAPYYAFPDSLKRPYTTQENTLNIKREFGHYHNKGTFRGVYPSALRQELCARQRDPKICAKTGGTWTTVSLPNVPRSRNEIIVVAGLSK